MLTVVLCRRVCCRLVWCPGRVEGRWTVALSVVLPAVGSSRVSSGLVGGVALGGSRDGESKSHAGSPSGIRISRPP